MRKIEGEGERVAVGVSRQVADYVCRVAEREKLPQSRIAIAMLREAVDDEQKTLRRFLRMLAAGVGKMTGQATDVGERPRAGGCRLQLASVPLEILAGVDRIGEFFGLSREETCSMLITGIIRDVGWVDEIVNRWLPRASRDVVYEGQRRAPKGKPRKA